MPFPAYLYIILHRKLLHTPAILHLNIGLAGSNGNNKPNAQLTVTQLNSSGWVYTDVDVRKSQLVKSKSFARLSRAVNYPRATLVIMREKSLNSAFQTRNQSRPFPRPPRPRRPTPPTPPRTTARTRRRRRSARGGRGRRRRGRRRRGRRRSGKRTRDGRIHQSKLGRMCKT